MSLPPLAQDAISIVVKGSFNPAIFSPAWMLRQDLIGPTEYAAAKVDLITQEFARFELGWLTCQVTQQDLTFSTSEYEEFERTRDAAVGALRVLSHTPVMLLGINRAMHFAVASAEQWHSIGDALAPKEVWEPSLILPGMKSVTIWGVRPDAYGGRVQVTVEPSNAVMPYGIYIAYNDHYELVKVDQAPTTRYEVVEHSREAPAVSPGKLELAVEILTQNWAASMNRAESVVEPVWKLRGSE